MGDDEPENGGPKPISLRASKKPSKHWRDDLRQKSKSSSDPLGHPQVWLMGDAIHAMQPHRYGPVTTSLRFTH